MRTYYSVFLCGLFAIACLVASGCGSSSYAPNHQQDGRRASSVQAKSEKEAAIDQRSPIQNTEEYEAIVENDFLDTLSNPKSTFSIDVDTASYSNCRRMIADGNKPPADAVRIEEFVNYFSYNYPQPTGKHPFSVTTEVASCPWESKHHLVRIALKGKEFQVGERPDSNLVFLIDVSGSMWGPRKLPLVKNAIRMLTSRLTNRDKVSMVVYAGSSGLVLPPTPGNRKSIILDALDSLEAGGSTNGGQGIQLAYRLAKDNFVEGGVNRVILCTDGDFNVGITRQSALVKLIQEKARDNIFLSVLGFGDGNYKDATMEKLADKGNGNYAYIDSTMEAKKSLIRQINGTLITIAKDVKIQVDFNPARIQAYRLIGYENRLLRNEDFTDDTKDAGEIGAGHTVTALYEIVPKGIESPARRDKPSEFVETRISEDANPDKLLNVALRYKQPEGTKSLEFKSELLLAQNQPLPQANSDFRFASAVASFAMLIRDSKYSGSADLNWVLETATENIGRDPFGSRREFIEIVKHVQQQEWVANRITD